MTYLIPQNIEPMNSAVIKADSPHLGIHELSEAHRINTLWYYNKRSMQTFCWLKAWTCPRITFDLDSEVGSFYNMNFDDGATSETEVKIPWMPHYGMTRINAACVVAVDRTFPLRLRFKSSTMKQAVSTTYGGQSSLIGIAGQGQLAKGNDVFDTITTYNIHSIYHTSLTITPEYPSSGIKWISLGVQAMVAKSIDPSQEGTTTLDNLTATVYLKQLTLWDDITT